MTKSVFTVRFKGVTGEGQVAGKDEDSVRRYCKKTYSAKLISIKFSHKMEERKKK